MELHQVKAVKPVKPVVLVLRSCSDLYPKTDVKKVTADVSKVNRK